MVDTESKDSDCSRSAPDVLRRMLRCAGIMLIVLAVLFAVYVGTYALTRDVTIVAGDAIVFTYPNAQRSYAISRRGAEELAGLYDTFGAPLPFDIWHLTFSPGVLFGFENYGWAWRIMYPLEQTELMLRGYAVVEEDVWAEEGPPVSIPFDTFSPSMPGSEGEELSERDAISTDDAANAK